MTGPPIYSQAARQALTDAYYNTQPRPRVEDLKHQAAAGELRTGPGPQAHFVGDNALPTETTLVDPSVQAEIAGMSRSSMFEIMRTDPRHKKPENKRARVELFGDILLDTMEHQLQRAAAARFPNTAELNRLHKAYAQLKADLTYLEETGVINDPPALAGIAAILEQGNTPKPTT